MIDPGYQNYKKQNYQQESISEFILLLDKHLFPL